MKLNYPQEMFLRMCAASFIIVIFILLISGCVDTSKWLRLNESCIKEIKSDFCKDRGGEIIYNQVDFKVLCHINFTEQQFRLYKKDFLICEVKEREYTSWWDRLNSENDCENCGYYSR